MAQLSTVNPLRSVQYTLVAPTAMAQGPSCPVAMAVGAPPHPPSRHFTGPAIAVQYALVPSTTMPLPPGPNEAGVHEAAEHLLVVACPAQYTLPPPTAIAVGAALLRLHCPRPPQ